MLHSWKKINEVFTNSVCHVSCLWEGHHTHHIGILQEFHTWVQCWTEQSIGIRRIRMRRGIRRDCMKISMGFGEAGESTDHSRSQLLTKPNLSQGRVLDGLSRACAEKDDDTPCWWQGTSRGCSPSLLPGGVLGHLRLQNISQPLTCEREGKTPGSSSWSALPMAFLKGWPNKSRQY